MPRQTQKNTIVTTNALSHSKRIFFLYLILILTLLNLINPAYAAKKWQNLAPGIEYQDVLNNPLTPWAHIYAFRIDLKYNQLGLISSKDIAKNQASINELARKSKALIAINGGFFDNQFRPLGLRRDLQKETNPVKRISWWGIFLIQNQTPEIITAREYQPNDNIQFAIQSGPRLIINGQIPHLKPGIAERTALGITPHNKLILIVTNNAMITTTELAKLMKAPPLNCKNALNLDGGSSSQLYAHIQSFRLNVYGFSNLSDAIVIKPKIN